MQRCGPGVIIVFKVDFPSLQSSTISQAREIMSRKAHSGQNLSRSEMLKIFQPDEKRLEVKNNDLVREINTGIATQAKNLLALMNNFYEKFAKLQGSVYVPHWMRLKDDKGKEQIEFYNDNSDNHFVVSDFKSGEKFDLSFFSGDIGQKLRKVVLSTIKPTTKQEGATVLSSSHYPSFERGYIARSRPKQR